MTYLLETARGFENDPSGSLSVGLVSAWPLTELAGPRRDSAGCLALRTTSTTRFSGAGATPTTGVSTGVLHSDDKFVAQFDGSPDGVTGTTNSGKMLFAPVGYNYGDRGAMTFSAWVYVDSTYSATAKLGLIGSHLNNDWLDGWYLEQIESSGNQRLGAVFAAGGAYSTLLGTTNLSTSTWYHAAFTWNGADRTVYINGASEGADTPAVFGAADTSAELCLGRMGNDGFPYTWHGRLCHAALWIKSLSAAEVLTLYNSGVPNRYKPWAAGG